MLARTKHSRRSSALLVGRFARFTVQDSPTGSIALCTIPSEDRVGVTISESLTWWGFSLSFVLICQPGRVAQQDSECLGIQVGDTPRFRREYLAESTSRGRLNV